MSSKLGICEYPNCKNQATQYFGTDHSHVCVTHKNWKPAPICARCGKPAKGWAMIDCERYCHEGTGATCFMQQSWENTPSQTWPPNKDAVMTESPEPVCGIAGCEGKHEPQDHNTVVDDYLRGKEDATQEIVEYVREQAAKAQRCGDAKTNHVLTAVAYRIEKGIHND